MSEVSDSQFAAFLKLFESELHLRLNEFSRANHQGTFILRDVSMSRRNGTIEVVARFDRTHWVVDEHYGYRIKRSEINDQANDDMSRAAYLCWLDIESELLAQLQTSYSAAHVADIIWLMDD